jgi:hypothetical protein
MHSQIIDNASGRVVQTIAGVRRVLFYDYFSYPALWNLSNWSQYAVSQRFSV